MELIPDQQQAYQEEQQVRICTWLINTELRVTQRQDELDVERVALDTQLSELHQCKAVLRMKHATTIDFTKARARARVITIIINREGTSSPTFARASQNVAMKAALLNTLPAASTDRVDKVYH
jgi:hypothetical protein